MVDFSDEWSLAQFILLNGAVFGSAWFFARRRVTTSRSQALLDAALLGYVIQYIAVGLPGLIGWLRPAVVCATALVISGTLIAIAWRAKTTSSVEPNNCLWIVAVGLFTTGYILIYAYTQADLPVLSNDALTYHFPAAVQWLQQGRIGLFNTWFFNPANTYSPLAGSTFIVWLMVPFGSDLMARFVEVPALFCVAIAMYRLCREVGARPTLAAMIAAAAVLARPVFLPCMMGKDDLFVAFFFIAILVAMSPQRAGERWGSIRLGIALGMLLATKYTALLSVPILLLAVDGPMRAGWSIRRWVTTAITAAFLAGPWYLRNLLATGNPLFPLDLSVLGVHVFHGLFTTIRSDVFHSIGGVDRTLIDGSFGMPGMMAGFLMLGWAAAWIGPARSSPLGRACLLGPVVGLSIFFWRSPFPEVRFVLPVFLLLFASLAMLLEQDPRRKTSMNPGLWPGSPGHSPGLNDRAHTFWPRPTTTYIASLIVALSAATVFQIHFRQALQVFIGPSLAIALLGTAAVWGTRQWSPLRRRIILISIVLVPLVVAIYIHWTAYCNDYRESLRGENTGYIAEYPQSESLWRFINTQLPDDATIACTNLYLVYPLQANSPRRRVVYAPVRAGIKSMADLGWLGNDLSGEALIPAAVKATIGSPDANAWLKNLRDTGSNYLVIGKGGIAGTAPEEAFTKADPQHMQCLFDGPGGSVYKLRPPIK